MGRIYFLVDARSAASTESLYECARSLGHVDFETLVSSRFHRERADVALIRINHAAALDAGFGDSAFPSPWASSEKGFLYPHIHDVGFLVSCLDGHAVRSGSLTLFPA